MEGRTGCWEVGRGVLGHKREEVAAERSEQLHNV
jgi:hypothetical protein